MSDRATVWRVSGTNLNTRAWQRQRRWWAQQLPLPCARCGQVIHPNDNWHLDHMIPRWAGGADDTARPSHAYCNLTVSNDHPRRPAAIHLADRVPPTTSRRW